MNLRFSAIMVLVLGAVVARFALSGVPNVAPITALALFSGAYLADRRLAILIPLVAMLLGDLVLGLHATMFFVYGTFMLITAIGIWMSSRVCGHIVIAASLGSSVLFFLVTNFGVWMVSGLYPMTLDGLATCYTLAIPFFQASLMGDLFFTGLIFGLFMLMEHLMPAIRRPANQSM